MKYDITPLAKPRMTRSDKWRQRPCVLKYRAFKDECRLKKVKVYEAFKVTFFMPMPNSWNEKKKSAWEYTPHQQTPDIDNLVKGLLDAVLEDDSKVWQVLAVKRWSKNPRIEIEYLEHDL